MERIKTYIPIIVFAFLANIACESMLHADYYDDGGAGDVLAPAATGALIGGLAGGGRGAGIGAGVGLGVGLMKQSSRRRSNKRKRQELNQAKREAYEQGRRDQQRQSGSYHRSHGYPPSYQSQEYNTRYQGTYGPQHSQFPDGGYQPRPEYPSYYE